MLSYVRTGYGWKDGNNMDNFAMLWKIDKIFGMLEDLMATNKATIFIIQRLSYFSIWYRELPKKREIDQMAMLKHMQLH